MTANAISYKQEVGRLTEELAAELSRRKMAEESCQKLIAEKGEQFYGVFLILSRVNNYSKQI